MWPFQSCFHNLQWNLLGPLHWDTLGQTDTPLRIVNVCDQSTDVGSCLQGKCILYIYIYYITYVWGLQQTNSQWLCCLWMMMELGTLTLGSPTYHEQGQFHCINLPSWNPTFHSDVSHVSGGTKNLMEVLFSCFFGAKDLATSLRPEFLAWLTTWESIRYQVPVKFQYDFYK